MRGRALKLVKNNSGVTMIYVLGVMMLLMVIGVSVLTAASANAGFTKKQKEHSQTVILADSVQRNILYSLQSDPSNENLLSRQLVYAIYKAKDENRTNGRLPDDMPVYVNFDNVAVTLSFPQQAVRITDARLVYYDEDSFYREPKTAVVGAEMTVTVTVNTDGKAMTSRARYLYTGGRLTDDPSGGRAGAETTVPFDMVFSDYGKWELKSHEKVDM